MHKDMKIIHRLIVEVEEKGHVIPMRLKSIVKVLSNICLDWI